MVGSARVRIMFFAAARDAVGKAEIEFPYEVGESLSTLLERLFHNHPRLGSSRQYRFAIDGEVVRKDPGEVRLSQVGEIAVLPPYSGG